jgi:hypothetical protein
MPDRRRFLTRSGLAAGGLILPGLRRSPPDAPLPSDSLPANPLQYGAELAPVRGVDPGQFIAQVRHTLAAAESLGIPIDAEDIHTLEAIQRVLDRSCLVAVHINPEMRVKVARGPPRPSLVQRDWRPFLVKVHNEAGTTAALRTTSVQGAHRWLDHFMLDDPPLTQTLSGLALEYRILRLYSHDAGLREASLAFDVGQGTQDLGFRNELPILFDCQPAR